MMTRINHLYVHVPFCNSICGYCDFCHRIYEKNTVTKWLETIEKEIIDKCNDDYETIYIGGGTPTSLNIDELDKLLSLLKPYSNKVIEYTIEVNPESLDINKIKLFDKYGINRISMGVQSSNDDLLKLMNRKHSFNDVRNKIQLLKDNGISNISIDLMYSLPNQTIDILNNTIDDFISLDIPHVSLYSLTIEDNSIFNKKGYRKLDDELEADMYELINTRLIENGYTQYEVSNYCKPGYESKHNMSYWNYEDFLGISLSASSKVGNKRWTNTSNFNSYFEDYNKKDEDLLLSIDDQKFENIMMSLRTSIGLNINEFNRKYNTNIFDEYKEGVNDPNIVIIDGYLKARKLSILNNTLLKFIK